LPYEGYASSFNKKPSWNLLFIQITTRATQDSMAERTHTGTGAGANVAHEKPIVKKEVVKEHPEVVHKEHHVQPIIHEKERHVQPIHKTEVTKEHPVEHRVSLLCPAGTSGPR